jgi:ABC-type protease/lipase transport system fused ATPase/permease subunit
LFGAETLLFFISLIEYSVDDRIIVLVVFLLIVILVVLSLEVIRVVVVVVLFIVFFRHCFKHRALVEVPIFRFIGSTATALANTACGIEFLEDSDTVRALMAGKGLLLLIQVVSLA